MMWVSSKREQVAVVREARGTGGFTSLLPSTRNLHGKREWVDMDKAWAAAEQTHFDRRFREGGGGGGGEVAGEAGFIRRSALSGTIGK